MTAPSDTPGNAAKSHRLVLVVDDEHEVRSILRTALERDGFDVIEAGDGPTALDRASQRVPDLIVLDLGLPGMSGLDVVRALRATGNVPVIILSGRGDVTDRIVGLEIGADDYIAKPFSPREVAARVSAVLRRTSPVVTARRLTFDELTIDLSAREVTLGERLVELTPKEFDLLAFLAGSPRQVFSADQLLRQVWRSDPEWQSTTTVREHVHRIRRKLCLEQSSPRWLMTVRGGGYRFDP